MTTFTNKHNVDEVIAKAVSRDVFYGRPDCDFTVTELIRPTQIAYLTQIHQHEIVEDVGERLWALLGSAVHEIVRKAAPDDALAEERLFANVSEWKIAGKADLWDDGVLTDYKVTSVWSFLLARRTGYVKPDWEDQLNFYAYLYRKNGFEVNDLYISAILRDWSARKAQEDKDDYPQVPFLRVKVPLWTFERQELAISHLIIQHAKALRSDYSDCTDEDRWNRPEFAVKKAGQKRAVRVFRTDDGEPETKAAELVQELNGKGFEAFMEQRGSSIRCQSYCPVREWCEQRPKVREAEGW